MEINILRDGESIFEYDFEEDEIEKVLLKAMEIRDKKIKIEEAED